MTTHAGSLQEELDAERGKAAASSAALSKVLASASVLQLELTTEQAKAAGTAAALTDAAASLGLDLESEREKAAQTRRALDLIAGGSHEKLRRHVSGLERQLAQEKRRSVAAAATVAA
eukprot:3190201-Prymnesium_polylepis.1